MTRFFVWMQQDEGWKTMLAAVYATICLFDFVVVPSWIGMTRPGIAQTVKNLPDAEVNVQLEYLKVLTATHSPFTLQGGGLFHLAFGALLTGSAINNRLSRKDEKNTP